MTGGVGALLATHCRGHPRLLPIAPQGGARVPCRLLEGRGPG